MSSNNPCLSLGDDMVEYNEMQKSNLTNLLNMYCLVSDNISKMAPKPGIQKCLWPFPFHYLSSYLLVQKSGSGHGTQGAHLCDLVGS